MLCELWLSQRYLRTGKKEKIISLTAFISMIGIAIGVLVLIVVIAVMSGFDRFLEDKITGTSPDLFLEFYRGEKEPYKLIDKLKGISHIQACAPFITGQAFIKLAEKIIINTELRGIEPELQPKISKIKEYIKQGTLDLEGNEVILGEELAFRLALRLGDNINLISPVTLKETSFYIKGIFKSGMYTYDASLILTSLKGAQDFFKIPGLVTGIGVKVDDIYRTEKIKEDIYRSIENIGQYELRTWVDANRNFLHALKLEKTVMFIVVTMTTVVAAFGIISTLIMSVMSKFKDIGILRSLGAKTKTILQIFIYQGLSIGITGIVLGLIGGVSLTRSLNKVVDFISGIIGMSLIPKDIYYFDRIPTSINVKDISLIVICALAISLLASIYPAFYATRINPAEAVRHE
jgi:lipoprotein-releasing system permease protein